MCARAAVQRQRFVGRVRRVVLIVRRVVDPVRQRQQIEHRQPHGGHVPVHAAGDARAAQRNLVARERLAGVRIDDLLQRPLPGAVRVAEVRLREVPCRSSAVG